MEVLNKYGVWCLCPIFKREIDNGYCYEITTAAYGMIKMECLDNKIKL
jgi:hypothetical protein